jgi:hypothetical protein
MEMGIGYLDQDNSQQRYTTCSAQAQCHHGGKSPVNRAGELPAATSITQGPRAVFSRIAPAAGIAATAAPTAVRRTQLRPSDPHGRRQGNPVVISTLFNVTDGLRRRSAAGRLSAVAACGMISRETIAGCEGLWRHPVFNDR